MLQQVLLPLSLPLGAPHPKSDRYLVIQVDNEMHHWALVETETGKVCEQWKFPSVSKQEIEEDPYLIMEYITIKTKQLLFQDQEPTSSNARRCNERIPMVNVYCFCQSPAHREIVSLLLRPCQVTLFEAPQKLFEDAHSTNALPAETSAAAMYVRNKDLPSIEGKLLFMAVGSRVDAVLMTQPETLLETFEPPLPPRGPSRPMKKAQRGLYEFLERHIQAFCQSYVGTDKEVAVFFGGCEAATLSKCLKQTGRNVRALPRTNAIHVKLPGGRQIYIMKLIVLETIHFMSLNALLSESRHDELVVVGCGVRKSFYDRFYNGYVATIGTQGKGEKFMYGIVYEDGDTEDYYAGELLEHSQQFVEYALAKRDPCLNRKGQQTQIAIKYLNKEIDSAAAHAEMDALFRDPLFPPRNP